MKGVICYYSGSGNTKLVCKYIANKITNAEFDLYNTLRNDNRDLEKYDLFGFATFTDFLGVPYFFKKFIDSLHSMYKKPAFVFNTYGIISGKTLIHMNRLVNLKGLILLRDTPYTLLRAIPLCQQEVMVISKPPIKER